MKKYCIISGGLGYIGLHIIQQLLDKFKIIIIDDLSNSNIKNLSFFNKNKNLIFIKRDICKHEKILSDLKKIKHIELFIHLSADKYVSSHFINHIHSIEQTLSVLKICHSKKIKKLFFSSSAAIYPDSKGEILNHYGLSKLINEDLIRKFYEYNYIIGRIFNPFGSNFTNIFFGEQLPVIEKIRSCKKYNLKFTINTNAQTPDKSGYRDFIEINDAISQILYLINLNKKITADICTGVAISVKSISKKALYHNLKFKKKSVSDLSFSKGNPNKNFKFNKKDITNKILIYINTDI